MTTYDTEELKHQIGSLLDASCIVCNCRSNVEVTIPYHIISYHIISYRIKSNHTISYHTISSISYTTFTLALYPPVPAPALPHPKIQLWHPPKKYFYYLLLPFFIYLYCPFILYSFPSILCPFPTPTRRPTSFWVLGINLSRLMPTRRAHRKYCWIFVE